MTETLATPAVKAWRARYWCGCGAPDQANAAFKELLGIYPDETPDGPRMPRSEAVKAFRDRYGDGMYVLCQYMLEAMGLTEHGTSAMWAWLTDEGYEIKRYVDGGMEIDDEDDDSPRPSFKVPETADDWLATNFCGCADPDAAWQALGDVFACFRKLSGGNEPLPDYPNWYINLETSREFGKRYSHGLLHLILYWLAGSGVIEHSGSVISSAWLSPMGCELVAMYCDSPDSVPRGTA